VKTVVRVVEFTHFTKDRRPKRFILDEVEPSLNEKGYPKGGGYIITIEDGEGRKSFGLSEAEAALLLIRLWNILIGHSNDFMNLWSMVRAQKKPEGEGSSS